MQYPKAWPWWVEDALPHFVKQTYSPRETWKNKPFTVEDAKFFFKGVSELSDLFTDERPKDLPAYFQHPKYRSAYLLYFVPLQAAKFVSLFRMHPGAIDAAIAHGREQGVLRVLDLGAGPGTASQALLLELLDRAAREDLPPIELCWVDTQRTVMEDGKKLVERIADQFPKLRGKVTVKTRTAPWWEARTEGKTSLVLVGHVLNEGKPPRRRSKTATDEDSEIDFLPGVEALGEIVHNARGGGVLTVEPAAKSPSQLLSRIRDQLVEAGRIADSPTAFWGPCLHAGSCPLATGRDWCHFSIRTEIPGKWFKGFSKSLGSERQWIKFSYLWLAASDAPAPAPAPLQRRIISDPLKPKGGSKEHPTLLLCEPERAKRIPAPVGKWLRGDLWKLRPEGG